MSENAIVDYLDEIFDGLKVDAIRNDATSSTIFQVEVSTGVDMLLSIHDDCFQDNSLADIEAAIQSKAKSLLDRYHNVVVNLNPDLTCSLS